jgi:hypothetical protein
MIGNAASESHKRHMILSVQVFASMDIDGFATDYGSLSTTWLTLRTAVISCERYRS